MIYSLRRKLIWICGCSTAAVLVLIFLLTWFLSMRQLNLAMDMITDQLSENGGAFPALDDGPPKPPPRGGFPDFFTEETPFSTRFFTARFNDAGELVAVNRDFISSVTEEEARAYAEASLARGRERGWIEGFRYKVYSTDAGTGVVFVDGKTNRSVSYMTLLSVGTVLAGSLLVITGLIVILSKRAVMPIAESYEKQKQFITDANHELKTPLTLILTNLDILESELGENEWLEDIRAEGERMSALVRQLVVLTQMDEAERKMAAEPFPLSATISDTVSEFQPLAERRGLSLRADIQPEVRYEGDEAAIRRLVAILLDNAVKYCDPAGDIAVTFRKKRRLILTVENACAHVDAITLDRLFDRFYRADRARTFDGGFGIGLSIAQSIAHRHRGDITARKKDAGRIEFKVTLRG